MKVGNSMVVSVEYTLKGEDGEVIESNIGKDPLVYLHGAGNIIEGLEDGLDELEVNDEFDVEVEPKYGYGKYESRLVNYMEKSRFPEDHPLEVGSTFFVNSPEGQKQIKVIEITEDKVKVDANHELAGKTLNFIGKILDIREATDDELAHGHVHGPGCDH